VLKKFFIDAYRQLKAITHIDQSPFAILNRASSRVIITSIRGYRDDNCSWKAAALTYYSLLSIIPVFAIAFGIASGFGLETRLEAGFKAALAEHPTITTKVVELTNNYIEHAKGGVIAGVGVIMLFWTALVLLSRIESSMNEIWKVAKGRSFFRMLSDYLTIVIFCPLFFAVSSSMSVYIMSTIQNVDGTPAVISQLMDHFIIFFFYLLPLFVSWLLFSLLYVFIPNTRVPIRFALTGGVVAGTLYQVIQWIYLNIQVSINQVGAVYGSFAAVPLFFIWVNASWIIALFGVELTYHLSIDEEEKKIRDRKKGRHLKVPLKQVAILIVYECVKRFNERSPPLNPVEFAGDAGISLRRSKEIFKTLNKAGLLTEVKLTDQENVYNPAFAITDMTILDVIKAIDTDRTKEVSVNHSAILDAINEALSGLDHDFQNSRSNLVLRDLCTTDE